jgi:integrase
MMPTMAKNPGLKGVFMAVNREKDRNGSVRVVVSKRWPDGSRFRRYFPNPTIAKKTLARIEESIAMGSWQRLREELTPTRRADADQTNDPTVREFSEVYLDKYCKIHNKRPDCKEQVLESVTRILGDVRVRSLRRSDVHHFIAERSKEVGPATVNRGVAVLKNMLTFALERDIIEMHPLLRFRMLKEEKPALRVMTLQEERRLIESIDEPTIAAYAAVLGETGLRKLEGLTLKWDQVNLDHRIVSAQYTKSRKPRYVPLSDFAIGWLRSLIRVAGCPYVFARIESRDRWRKPEGPFNKGRAQAKLDWISIHDLRHFRATQWVQRGVDLRTVQELLGHSSITTTMTYAHFAASHASRSILEAQRLEQEELKAGDKRATPETEQETSNTPSPANLVISMPGTGVEPVRPLRGSGF